MKIPKTIKIGGFIWKIEHNQDVNNSGDTFGETHFKLQKIFVEPSITEQKQEQTLLHEVLHAIMWQSGLSLRLKNKEVVSEEDVVHTLSMGLHQVLKDNKFV